ncbi:RepB family plasmid replication initiator protein [Buttiauxella agrestis]|uniref:RepB family plasmid replication initiator protein n=1 Tax=Buttiauxella agrestis TaxID=82977 RepID=UPI0039764E76
MTEKGNTIKEITKAFTEINKRTGEVVNLVPNSNNTVQPVALMRLGLFVPTLKSTARGRKGQMSTMDATAELKQLSLVTSEGFENIQITGARLDMDNDFKTWVGIIHAFTKFKVIGDKVTLPFVEFTKLCGIPSSRSSAALRKRIDSSLQRITTNTLSFSSKDKTYHTHLVQSAYFDMKEDVVVLQADPKLFELYQFDRKVLLQLQAINELARKESAQALYTYIESLPQDIKPISMSRFRARLNLTSRAITQNATVRKAMAQLKEIGYLDYTEYQRGRAVYFHIHYRRPKLRPASIPMGLPENPEDELPMETEELVVTSLTKEELALLESLRGSKK